MVVVLHGCSQGANSAAQLTGWNNLADEYGFYVLYIRVRDFYHFGINYDYSDMFLCFVTHQYSSYFIFDFYFILPLH